MLVSACFYVESVIPLHSQSLEQIDYNTYSKKPIEKSYAKYYGLYEPESSLVVGEGFILSLSLEPQPSKFSAVPLQLR
jgi:hypothetical protein